MEDKVDKTYIFHICTKEEWEKKLSSNEYIHPSLKTENFIHNSEEHQIEGVLQRYFKGQNDLLKLTIDPDKLTSRLQYDLATDDEYFPHVYGPINKDAIVKVERI